MQYAWLALSAMVKLALAAGPVLAREKEFGLSTKALWSEAREVATVTAMRGMMASFLLLLALQTLQATEVVCAGRGVGALIAACGTVGLFVLTYGALRFPVAPLRVPIVPFVLAAVLIIAEFLYTSSVLNRVAGVFCVPAP